MQRTRRVGRRQHAQDLGRGRVDAVIGNLVALERSRGARIGYQYLGSGKIAAPECGTGNCRGIEIRGRLAQAFVIEKEKRLLLAVVELGNADRSTQLAAEQVVAVPRAGLAEHVVEE